MPFSRGTCAWPLAKRSARGSQAVPRTFEKGSQEVVVVLHVQSLCDVTFFAPAAQWLFVRIDEASGGRARCMPTCVLFVCSNLVFLRKSQRLSWRPSWSWGPYPP